MQKIYESPDGGKTIYVREFGSADRTLYEHEHLPIGHLPGSLEDKLKIIANNNKRSQEQKLWRDILEAAKTNIALAEMLAQVKTLYLLSKDDEDISSQT